MIKVNGESYPIAIKSIAEYLKNEGLQDKKGIAIACNQEVIEREAWESFPIKDGDEILILEATQGG